ncbi:MAG: hypothetical protein WA414_07655 [Acidobacteriaceae bacterium]
MRLAFAVLALGVTMGACAQNSPAPPHVAANSPRVHLAGVPSLDRNDLKTRIVALIPEAKTKGRSGASAAVSGPPFCWHNSSPRTGTCTIVTMNHTFVHPDGRESCAGQRLKA